VTASWSGGQIGLAQSTAVQSGPQTSQQACGGTYGTDLAGHPCSLHATSAQNLVADPPGEVTPAEPPCKTPAEAPLEPAVPPSEIVPALPPSPALRPEEPVLPALPPTLVAEPAPALAAGSPLVALEPATPMGEDAALPPPETESPVSPVRTMPPQPAITPESAKLNEPARARTTLLPFSSPSVSLASSLDCDKHAFSAK
jgi:hypothetical protein